MANTHTNRLTAIQPANVQPEVKVTSTALKPIEPNDLNEVMTFAQIAIRSGMFGIKTVEEAAYRILYGRELGMSVFQSIMGIDIIQGRPGLKAGTVASMIQRSGRYEYRVNKWDATQCVINFIDRGEVVGASSFTIEDAKRAGVFKQGSNWDKYPKAMLFARAITQGARAYCPSIFFGPIYSSEELQGGFAEVIDAEVVDETPVTPAAAAPAEKPAAKPKTKAVKADPVEPPFDPQPEPAVEPAAQPVDDFGDRVRRVDEWADRAAKRFDEKGFPTFSKPGQVIDEIYLMFVEAETVQAGITGYRNQVNAIARISPEWPFVLEQLKSAASMLMTQLEAPPAEIPADEPEPMEPGSNG